MGQFFNVVCTDELASILSWASIGAFEFEIPEIAKSSGYVRHFVHGACHSRGHTGGLARV
jgi:hypothetical protein